MDSVRNLHTIGRSECLHSSTAQKRKKRVVNALGTETALLSRHSLIWGLSDTSGLLVRATRRRRQIAAPAREVPTETARVRIASTRIFVACGGRLRKTVIVDQFKHRSDRMEREEVRYSPVECCQNTAGRRPGCSWATRQRGSKTQASRSQAPARARIRSIDARDLTSIKQHIDTIEETSGHNS